ncbi:glycoside hydrolase family 28 protein [candidate division KSB1 bacterium]|nr:glycoside hydrolase family 28 protein [candidate division KSB1 bacterium]
MKKRPSSALEMLIIVLFIMSISITASDCELKAQSDLRSEVDSYLEGLPFEMPAIELPSFPDSTFNIIDYDAVNDGHSLNTEAFRKTIQACSDAGGGTVTVPHGIWLTGPIRLESNINLHLDQGAMILFTPDRTQYPIIKTPSRGFLVTSPIYGFHLENVAITGEGIIDGSGEAWRPVKKFKTTSSQWEELLESGGVVDAEGKIWWPSQEALDGERYLKELKDQKSKQDLTENDFLPARDYMRPYMVLFVHCKKVLVDGVTIRNSPKFVLVPNWSEHIVIRNVKVNNEWWAQNGDGIDISSCKNVLIYKCIVSVGDDAICMKSDSKKNSHEPSLMNVVITDCNVYHGHGGFVIGSNTDGGIKNISVKNCNFIDTDVGLRFKSARGRGGLVEHIYMNDIFMKDIMNEAILFNAWYDDDPDDEEHPISNMTPRFRNFRFNDIYCIGARQAVSILGLPEMPVQDIEMNNLHISADKGFEVSYATDMVLKNISIVPRDGVVYSIHQSSSIIIENGLLPQATQTFMKVTGDRTANIRVVRTDLSSIDQPIDYADDADKKAVIVE